MPPSKAGRKLQCRRCGATQRIPRPSEDEDLLVPFEVLESDEGQIAPPPPPRRDEPQLSLAPGSDSEPPLERKRRRKRKPREEADEDEGEPRRRGSGRRATSQQPERSALRRLTRLARSSWWALTPAGLVWGPWIALQTQGLDGRLGSSAPARAQLRQVLLTAWTGSLLWGLVVVFGALRTVASPAPPDPSTAQAPELGGGAGQGAEDLADPAEGPATPVAGPSRRLADVVGEPHPLRRLLVLSWADEAPGQPARPADPAAFEARLGRPLQKALSEALNDGRPAVRRAGLRLAQRAALELPRPRLDGLARDPDYGVRLAAARLQRTLEDPAWGATLLSVALSDSALPAALARAEALEATADPAAAARLLEGASEVRRQLGRSDEEPILAWPKASLPHAAALLGNPTTRAEAYAVLHAGGDAAVEPLIGVARQPASGSGEREALGLLATLTVEGACPLRRFLDTVEGVGDATAQTVALQTLTQQIRVPGADLTAWILEVLRTQPQSPLGRQLAPLLADVGIAPGTDVAWLVEDLTRPGDHDAVLKELHSTRRAGDPELDRALRRTASRIKDPHTRLQVLDLAQARLFPDSLEILLDGLEDSDDALRLHAAKLLNTPNAPEPDDFRKRAAQVLATRLRNEREDAILELLYPLASGGRFGWLRDKRKNAEYDLSNSLRDALRQNARKGSVDAVRALATHPSEKTLKTLIEVLDRTRESDVRLQILAALNRLTGWRKATDDPGHWKESLQPLPGSVQEILTQLTQQDLSQREAIEARAAARLAEAEARFAELKRKAAGE
ncbi:MAG: hypothetical protein R3F62_03130 [Planctomycetota bacterium]